MKSLLMTGVALATGALLTAGLAFGQTKEDCMKRTQTPERVEGQVVAVDQNAGKVTSGTPRAPRTSSRPIARRCRT